MFFSDLAKTWVGKFRSMTRSMTQSAVPALGDLELSSSRQTVLNNQVYGLTWLILLMLWAWQLSTVVFGPAVQQQSGAFSVTSSATYSAPKVLEAEIIGSMS